MALPRGDGDILQSSDRRDPQADIASLRARLEQLERERVEQVARANTAVAAAQDRAYWLDRWHVDLNALMQRRGADEFRAALRAGRTIVRKVTRAVGR